MNYDDILAKLGNSSAYQLRNYILLCVPIILCAFHTMSSVFILGKMNHRCRLDPEPRDANFSLPLEVLNVSYPFDMNRGTFSNCSFYTDHYFAHNTTMHEEHKCHGDYIWDHGKFHSSAYADFELVCDRDYYKAISDSLFMVGVFLGSFIFGYASDVFGRKKVFVFSLLLQLSFGILMAFATNIYMLTIFRMVVGASNMGVFLVAYCLSLEMFGKEVRMQAGVCYVMFFSCGYIIMGFIAYFVDTWRWYQIAITLPGIIFLSYWWFIPESVRWLLTKNKMDQVIDQIQKIAKSSKVDLPKELLDKFIESETQEYRQEHSSSNSSALDLFRQPHLRVKAAINFLDWFLVSAVYYGLSWSTGDLIDGNPKLNHILSGIAEIPGLTILLLTLNRFGRKKVLAGNLTFAGIALIASILVPQNIEWLVVTLTMLGKMAATASFGTLYLFSVEQFPTVIRNVALGMCSMSARVGSALSPFIIYGGVYWKHLPFLIFGIGAFIGGFSTMFLSETSHQDLPDFFIDAEKMDHEQSSENNNSQEKLQVPLKGSRENRNL